MLQYIGRRVVDLAILLLLISILVFIAMHLIPGNPVDVFYGMNDGVNDETRSILLRQLGLDQPVPFQYVHWLTRILQGDWGYSFRNRQPVFYLVFGRLLASFWLAVFSIAFAVALAVPLGILAASQNHTIVDQAIQIIVFLSQSIPSFWVGIILILTFSLKLRWLPTYGFVSPSENAVDALRHLVMPSLTLGLGMGALLTRLIRSSMIEELKKDYIVTAKSKGLAENVIFRKHALKNSLIPSLTMLGVLFGFAMSGSVVVETVFSWPGEGRLLLDSILGRDYPVIQGIVMVNASVFVVANLLVDILYALIDPRIRIASERR